MDEKKEPVIICTRCDEEMTPTNIWLEYARNWYGGNPLASSPRRTMIDSFKRRYICQSCGRKIWILEDPVFGVISNAEED